MLKVRAGDWIMLAGTRPTHRRRQSMPVFKWYRVSETDSGAGIPHRRRHYAIAVSLTGPDWDISPANQQAVIVEGVVGVYEKTIRLENRPDVQKEKRSSRRGAERGEAEERQPSLCASVPLP